MHSRRSFLLGAGAGAALLAGCTPWHKVKTWVVSNPLKPDDQSALLKSALDELAVAWLKEQPQEATSLGVSEAQAGGRFADRLGDASTAGIAAPRLDHGERDRRDRPHRPRQFGGRGPPLVQCRARGAVRAAGGRAVRLGQLRVRPADALCRDADQRQLCERAELSRRSASDQDRRGHRQLPRALGRVRDRPRSGDGAHGGGCRQRHRAARFRDRRRAETARRPRCQEGARHAPRPILEAPHRRRAGVSTGRTRKTR